MLSRRATLVLVMVPALGFAQTGLVKTWPRFTARVERAALADDAGALRSLRAEAERAAELAPDNPRVLVQQAVSAFHTPPMFGGGHDQAERLLRRGVERFASEPSDHPWPNWGRFDAHVWLGQVLAGTTRQASIVEEANRQSSIVDRQYQ